jgi:hypothetical protein
VGRFGGRNRTIISALLIIAATTGFGGGNFASSMTNLPWRRPRPATWGLVVRRCLDGWLVAAA